MNRSQIIRFLQEGVAVVRFTKADGTTANKKYTLMESLIPRGAENDGGLNPATVTAYDIEKNAWRSFRVDSLLEDPRRP